MIELLEAYLGKQRCLIQRPFVLPAGSLDESGEVGFGDMEAGEPHDNWLRFYPVGVLFIALPEVNLERS